MAASGVIHILNEEASPSSSMTSKMWCGAECIELFDGSFTPDLDFCYEAQAEFTTCDACRKAFEARVVSL
jgi:hypothetical protein